MKRIAQEKRSVCFDNFIPSGTDRYTLLREPLLLLLSCIFSIVMINEELRK